MEDGVEKGAEKGIIITSDLTRTFEAGRPGRGFRSDC
jgi:hypothetical protein